MYDIIIVGAGPAGLTAALYACRSGKKVLIIEKETFGGQITFSPKVENIPGFMPLSGNEFADKMVDQVLNQGAEFESGEVIRIEDRKESKLVCTEDNEYESKTVILATGAKHRLTGAENEARFIGNGISFCAVCDGAFYKDQKVAVIGGGNSALQESILLADLVTELTVVQNLSFLTGEQKLIDQLVSRENVRIIYDSVMDSYIGNDELQGIRIKNVKTGVFSDIHVDGVFVAIGLVPQNKAFASLIQLDERGYADSDEKCITKTKGIFVAGDCRKKDIRQVATAASDGAIAALAACRYLDE